MQQRVRSTPRQESNKRSRLTQLICVKFRPGLLSRLYAWGNMPMPKPRPMFASAEASSSGKKPVACPQSSKLLTRSMADTAGSCAAKLPKGRPRSKCWFSRAAKSGNGSADSSTKSMPKGIGAAPHATGAGANPCILAGAGAGTGTGDAISMAAPNGAGVCMVGISRNEAGSSAPSGFSRRPILRFWAVLDASRRRWMASVVTNHLVSPEGRLRATTKLKSVQSSAGRRWHLSEPSVREKMTVSGSGWRLYFWRRRQRGWPTGRAKMSIISPGCWLTVQPAGRRRHQRRPWSSLTRGLLPFLWPLSVTAQRSSSLSSTVGSPRRGRT
eukprot:m.287002 g.287002  ORF g.287002 m.287002 type:complete len:327 (+) comp11685_c0_seq1:197-1177(+)